MASLSPAAMRSTRISSEEFSTDVAAFAGTAAADRGQNKRLKHVNSPSHVPPDALGKKSSWKYFPGLKEPELTFEIKVLFAAIA